MKSNAKKTRPAEVSGTGSQPFFRLRVLLEFNKQYGVYAAHCLETGNVVTAETSDQAEEMIKELLEDELCFAIEHNNLRNLYSSPAPMEIWKRWHQAAREQKNVKTVPLNISAQEIKVDPESEYNEVDVVKAA